MNKITKGFKVSLVILAAAVVFSAVSNLMITSQENKIAVLVSQDKKIYSEAIMLRKNISELVSMQAEAAVVPAGVNEVFKNIKETLNYFAKVSPQRTAEINALYKGVNKLKDNALNGASAAGAWRIFGQADEFVGNTIKSVSGKSYKLPAWVFILLFISRIIWAAFFAVFAGFVYYKVSGLYKEGVFERFTKNNPVVLGLSRFINLLM
ncbi:MAG: hypothetical protein JXR81_02555 [Candidatus Goldbacteria bacterium]|nr:hypothetical protein [Candidatus Goldiibacteriota bacterium]